MTGGLSAGVLLAGKRDDIDLPGTTDSDDQHGRAALDRLVGVGDERLPGAADRRDDLAGPVATAHAHNNFTDLTDRRIVRHAVSPFRPPTATPARSRRYCNADCRAAGPSPCRATPSTTEVSIPRAA